MKRTSRSFALEGAGFVEYPPRQLERLPGRDVRRDVHLEVGGRRRHIVVNDVAVPDDLVVDQCLLEPVREKLSVPSIPTVCVAGSAK